MTRTECDLASRVKTTCCSSNASRPAPGCFNASVQSCLETATHSPFVKRAYEGRSAGGCDEAKKDECLMPDRMWK